MKKLTFVLLCLVLGVRLASAQTTQVTGTVIYAEDGEPIIGASIVVKGSTTIGTVTDYDGKFSLSVPSSATTLVFLYVGMTTKEEAIKSVMRVVMEPDVKSLDEVVVTAIGIKRSEKSLGYSMSKVKAEDVNVAGEPDMLKSLQGKVAGVDIRSSQGTPGAATRISIRGASSFTGSSEPLIVIDGVPLSNEQISTANQTEGGGAYSSGLSSIDPNDIESMSVLKGSAAAALYGSRAANGALIIKTKSGSATGGAKKFGVTFNSAYSFEKISSLPDYQNTYGSGAGLVYSNSNGSWGPRFDSLDEVPAWDDYYNAFPDLFPGGMIPYEAVPNNVKDLFQTGLMWDNSVNLAGGNETSAFNVTLSHMDQTGYVPNSSYKRIGISAGGSTELMKGFKVRGNMSYSNTDQIGSMFGDNQVSGASSSFARTLFLARNWNLKGLPYQTADGRPVSPLSAQFDNPLWAWQHNTSTTETDRVIASVGLDYEVTDWFSASYSLGTNVFSLNRKEVIDIGSRAADGKGQITDDKYRSVETESTLLLTFQKDIREDYSVKLILGHNANERKNTRTAIQGKVFKSPGIYDLSNTNLLTIARTNTGELLGDPYSKRRLMGVFADLTLGYKNWAFLGLTARNDWSSTLPTAHNSYFYPAVTGSFVFSDAFELQGDIFSFGKIRAGWAKVGRDADPYYLYNVYSLNDPFGGQTSAGTKPTARNLNLKPEFSEEVELGTQLEFFQRRLSFDFAWYNKISTNLIAPITVAPSSGYVEAFENFGKIRNRGVELNLNGVAIDTKDLRWELGLTFTKNKNVVLELKEGMERMPLYGVLTEISPYLEVGMPFGYLRGSANRRDEDGNLLIDPSTGLLIRDPEQKMVGDPNPDFKMGFNTLISYKGFFVNAHFDLTKGGDIYSSTVNTLLGRGVTRDTEDREHVWIIPGVYGDSNTGAPLLDANGNKIPNTTQIETQDLYFGESFAINAATEWSIFDATVLRMRELSFGYNFPKQILKATPLGALSLTVSGNNLWFYAPNIPKYTNFDPAANSFGSTTTQGIELSAAPSSRRFTVALRATF